MIYDRMHELEEYNIMEVILSPFLVRLQLFMRTVVDKADIWHLTQFRGLFKLLVDSFNSYLWLHLNIVFTNLRVLVRPLFFMLIIICLLLSLYRSLQIYEIDRQYGDFLQMAEKWDGNTVVVLAIVRVLPTIT